MPPDRLTMPAAVRAVEHRREALAAPDGVLSIEAGDSNGLRLLLHGTRLDPQEATSYVTGIAHVLRHEVAVLGLESALAGRLLHALMVGYAIGNGSFGADSDRIAAALNRFATGWSEIGSAVKATGQCTPVTLKMDRLYSELNEALTEAADPRGDEA